MSATIVNPNTNLFSVDTWALVSDDTVINTILDTTEDMNSSEILNSYDYVVDLTMQGQAAGVGWTYNPGGNTFTAPPPPPIDWQDVVQTDFDTVMQDLIQLVTDCGSDGGSLTTDQIQAAYEAALEDSEADFTPNQLALMGTILSYVKSGG